jgi:hypothetical protein
VICGAILNVLRKGDYRKIQNVNEDAFRLSHAKRETEPPTHERDILISAKMEIKNLGSDFACGSGLHITIFTCTVENFHVGSSFDLKNRER